MDAPLGARVTAVVVDLLAGLGLWCALASPLGWLLALAAIALLWAGMTPGMLVSRLRVRTVAGDRAGLLAELVRNAVYGVLVALGLALVGGIELVSEGEAFPPASGVAAVVLAVQAAAWWAAGRGLPELVSGTRVVQVGQGPGEG